jgi:hypothetical protein
MSLAGFVSAKGGSAFGGKKFRLWLRIVYREIVVVYRVKTKDETDSETDT